MKHIKFLIPLIIIITILSAGISASAVEYEYEEIPAPDLERKCSIIISVALESSDSYFGGAEVTLYKVADITYNDGIEYHYTKDFENCHFRMRLFDAEQTAKNMLYYAEINDIKGITAVSDDYGRVVYNDLEPGLYLIVMSKVVNELYAFDPFFISLPYMINDEWTYSASSAPKVDIANLKEKRINVSVKKIWNDDGESRPEYIEVELINDYGSYSTVKLSEKNDWKHTWKSLTDEENWSVIESVVPEHYTVTYQQNGNDFIIQNTQKLINTGQLNKPVPMLLCSGLLLIAVGISLYTSEGCKNEKN